MTVLEGLAAVLLVVGSVLVLWAVARADRTAEREREPARPEATPQPLRPAA